MRIFVAIEIPTSIQQQLADFQGVLRSAEARISWTQPSNIHLTLKFLGEIDRKALDYVRLGCKAVCEGISHFSLGLQGSGVFPNRKQPRVLWVGLGGRIDKVVELASRLNDALATKGFSPDSKPLRPHLTVGRIKSIDAIEETLTLASTYAFEQQEFEVREIVIVQSELGRSAPTYTVISRLAFTGFTSTRDVQPRHQ